MNKEFSDNPKPFYNFTNRAGDQSRTGSLPILTFHDLDDRSSAIFFSPRVFRHGIARLHESGYRTLRLVEAVDCVLQRKPFPDRSVVITFDDGNKSVFEKAFPVLKLYDMSATVFLTVGKNKAPKSTDRLPAIAGGSMLSWEEIMEMHRCGIDFGAHTLTHQDLTRLPLELIEEEIYESKAIIEDMLSSSVNYFAYPYGRYHNLCREIVRKHFDCACSDKLGLLNSSSDLYALERVDAYYLRTERLFDLMLTEFFPWYIKARNIPRQIQRAIKLSFG